MFHRGLRCQRVLGTFLFSPIFFFPYSSACPPAAILEKPLWRRTGGYTCGSYSAHKCFFLSVVEAICVIIYIMYIVLSHLIEPRWKYEVRRELRCRRRDPCVWGMLHVGFWGDSSHPLIRVQSTWGAETFSLIPLCGLNPCYGLTGRELLF